MNEMVACPQPICISAEKPDDTSPWRLAAECDGLFDNGCGFHLVVDPDCGHISDVVFNSEDVDEWKAQHQAHARTKAEDS